MVCITGANRETITHWELCLNLLCCGLQDLDRVTKMKESLNIVDNEIFKKEYITKQLSAA